MIALEDLKDKTEQDIIEHLSFEYAVSAKYDSPNLLTKDKVFLVKLRIMQLIYLLY